MPGTRTLGTKPGKPPSKLALAITHRLTIAALSLALVVVLVPGLIELIDVLRSWNGDPQRPRSVLTGLSTMLIGYGVVVEERSYINQKLGIYPLLETDHQIAVDERCHAMGFAALALGLLAEVLFQLVELPNTFLNTEQVDWVLLACSTGVLCWVALLLILHAARMLTNRV